MAPRNCRFLSLVVVERVLKLQLTLTRNHHITWCQECLLQGFQAPCDAILSRFFFSAFFVSVATPAEPRAEEKLYLCKFWGGEKLFEKCGWNIFKRPERGLNIFKHVSGRFSDLFSRFSIPFSYQFKLFSGAVSFCRRATLVLWAEEDRIAWWSNPCNTAILLSRPSWRASLFHAELGSWLGKPRTWDTAREGKIPRSGYPKDPAVLKLLGTHANGVILSKRRTSAF